MDKRERKSRLKDIVEMVDKCIVGIEQYDKKIMVETQKKIDDLLWHLEEHCIVPNSFRPEKIMKDILVEYFNYDEEIIDVRKNITSLIDDVCEHIEEMKEGSNKEEWKEFYSCLYQLEDLLHIEEQEIKDIKEFIEHMKELKSRLQDLI